MWLPDKDAAIEVDAEAEEGLDVAPVAVSVALQALQQDPATHANQSIHLSHYYRSIQPSRLPHYDQSINPPDRSPHKNTSIYHVGRPSRPPRNNTSIQLVDSRLPDNHHAIHQAGWHRKINQSTCQAATQLSSNLTNRLLHKSQSIHLAGSHTKIYPPNWKQSMSPSGRR